MDDDRIYHTPTVPSWLTSKSSNTATTSKAYKTAVQQEITKQDRVNLFSCRQQFQQD
jgi:hypothetical protein